VILFTADWHIKLGQKNVPVDWAINRYHFFFDTISLLEKEVDCHVIGGDLFDRLPTMEELELYFTFISNVTIPTLIFDGNHEATKKHKTFFSNLKEATRNVNAFVDVIDYSYADSEIPPHVKPEVDLSIFDEFPIVFAGDLHSHSNTQRNIVYPGSPMTTSFHRNKVDTGYLLIDENNDYQWEWKKFELPQLIRKTVSSPEEMIPTTFDHTIYELEGDMQDLANVEDSDLLDKKVIKRSTEASLVIDKDMTKEEELVEYLTYILEIPEEKIPNILGTYNDYAKKAQLG
jgi:DNA repair exonuclease SbcCD nuclease subunit